MRTTDRSCFQAVTEDALAVRLKDEPGALAKVVKRFEEAAIDPRSVRFIRRQRGYACVAIAMDQLQEARNLIDDYLVNG